jgi:tetratricopeptide (TPR) repeat protein
MRVLRSLVLVSLCALFLASEVSAQAALAPAAAAADDAARSLFEAGAIAYAEGRYDDALACFERAYDLAGHPELLYNIALAHDRLRHDAEALASFRAFLERAPEEAPHRAEVASRIAVLERTIAQRQALERRVQAEAPERATQRRRRRRRILLASAGVALVALVVVPVALTRGRTEQGTPSDFGGAVIARFGGAR